VFFADWRIRSVSSDLIFNAADSISYNKVGLVPGTARLLPGGRENLYFKYRIEAAVELFETGKIDFILVSGDNGTKYYNEPLDMKRELLKRGVPKDRIYLDYAGFRTYDSMIRANKIFGQSSLTVISQKFHIQRAVFIGKKLNMDVIGYEARDVSKHYGFKTRLREKFARVKVFIDFLFGTNPRFLGDAIEIPDVKSVKSQEE
jgi:SanA protein